MISATIAARTQGGRSRLEALVTRRGRQPQRLPLPQLVPSFLATACNGTWERRIQENKMGYFFQILVTALMHQLYKQPRLPQELGGFWGDISNEKDNIDIRRFPVHGLIRMEALHEF
ncbi:hypothetical protein Acr_04g0001910 [Actinidia rufa]|uniref:Uncharacterized protein n=1 Tax=Actinidia rufa TaxID=165716 RepID=A0A7J0EG61_9ERIC|nr:hypothetical protein Acr_04g0001910 [Actinidia rufa]